MHNNSVPLGHVASQLCPSRAGFWGSQAVQVTGNKFNAHFKVKSLLGHPVCRWTVQIPVGNSGIVCLETPLGEGESAKVLHVGCKVWPKLPLLLTASFSQESRMEGGHSWNLRDSAGI